MSTHRTYKPTQNLHHPHQNLPYLQAARSEVPATSGPPSGPTTARDADGFDSKMKMLDNIGGRSEEI